MAPQAGLAQVTRDGATAFHCERRWRVLLRDIFRFGTAMSISSTSAGPVSGSCASRPGSPAGVSLAWCWVLLGVSLGVLLLLLLCVLQGCQPGPPRVDRLVVPVVGILGQACPALGAQPWTVLLAQRLEG